MDKQTRIGRLVRQFLGDRFSASTEQRVQRWLVEERDDEEKEAASLEFWESLAEAPASLSRRSWERVAAKAGIAAGKRAALVRRWVGIAAAIAIPLVALTGGLVYYAGEMCPERKCGAITTEQTPAAEVGAGEPMIFEKVPCEAEVCGKPVKFKRFDNIFLRHKSCCK